MNGTYLLVCLLGAIVLCVMLTFWMSRIVAALPF